jgi:hypothetical protein
MIHTNLDLSGSDKIRENLADLTTPAPDLFSPTRHLVGLMKFHLASHAFCFFVLSGSRKGECAKDKITVGEKEDCSSVCLVHCMEVDGGTIEVFKCLDRKEGDAR